MITLLRLVNDIFDDPKLSDDKLRTFGDDHIIRLANNNPGGIYDGLITATTNAYTSYYGSMTNEAVKEAVSEGFTINMNAKREAVLARLSKQQALVDYLFGEDSDTYQAFFPQGMTEYLREQLDNLTTILDRYLVAANANFTGAHAAEATDIAGLISAYKSARTAQRDAFSETDTLRTGRRETRKVLTLQLTRNILTLAIDFLENPDRFDDYYDVALLPKNTSSNGEDDTATTISGNVRSTLTNQPIVNARVVLSNADGSVEAFTDANGNYEMPLEIEETTTAELRAEAPDHSTSNRPITIQPGQDQVQDYQLGPIPMP